MSLCLTHDEIKEITGKTKYSAQQRVLRAMGIDSKPRPDGTILVDRAVYNDWARGSHGARQQHEEKTQPRWDS